MRRLLLTAALLPLLAGAGLASAQPGPRGPMQGGPGQAVPGPGAPGQPGSNWRPGPRRLVPYDEGYERGYRDGVRDARRGRPPVHERRAPRGESQRGYLDGYRAGFWSERDGQLLAAPPAARHGFGRRGPASDPAFARGQADGYRRGFEDGGDGDRYDPRRERAYRDGDAGYFKDYGAKDAYRRNYRDGFRQGYEDGFRDGTRGPAAP